MSTTYVITFVVRPSERSRFLALLNPVLDAMRDESTFEYAALHVDPSDENRFQLHETWESHADVVDVQLHRHYRAAWHHALEEILERPRDITIWDQLRAD
ncbi:putative quinol monooxygenase [Mycolicibacterium obuense]|uniref:Antibiotic biosynthesis monooxygenase n=1 Tax=Mycolicibacterium obuense TaxID=1807 RepID=A0A0M2K180_9MYCO|nr:antibiotic biosynthesis monooxygenase [Mycolicibacterium obuense]KKF00872.1 antibiotic biosynthesis monooxygenase [Mycolicibacterium obuense]